MPARRFFNGILVLALLLSLSVSLFAFHAATARPSAAPSSPTRHRAAPPLASLSLTANENGRENYVGDAACQSCHEAIDRTFLQTAHHLSSQIPTENSVAGKFTAPSNILRTIDSNLHFKMTVREGSFYQTAVFGLPPDELTQTERIDLIVGSGARGQTYLYWKGDRLFQLPVSYWTPLGDWVDSPGYADGTADFNRPIEPRCLECHAGYFASIPSGPPKNRFRKTGFVLGISCERCHGPGRQHVAAEMTQSAHVHRSPPGPSAADRAAGDLGVVNPARLPRDRQIDVCAQCHGGLGDQRTPAFSFVPGRPLADYLELRRPDADAKVDVHGNQVALFERSRCFQSSTKMTCTLCHDVHAPERTAAEYSDRCLGCHRPESCGLYPRLGPDIAKNCVDCHMPVQDSNVIVSNVSGKPVKMRIRNHWIKIYATQ